MFLAFENTKSRIARYIEECHVSIFILVLKAEVVAIIPVPNSELSIATLLSNGTTDKKN